MMNAAGRHKKTGKVFVGNKLTDELDRGGTQILVSRPLTRGILHDSDLQSVIWKKLFQQFGKKFDERSSCLCLTGPPLIPELVQERLAELVFEDF